MRITSVSRLVGCLLALAITPSAVRGGTVGITHQASPSQVVKLRYKMRVNNNFSTNNLKILFTSRTVYDPANGVPPYFLEANLYSNWVGYSDTSCIGWPPQGVYHQGEAGLWMSIPDYVQVGLPSPPKPSLVGVKPSDTVMFPRQNSGVDNIPEFTKIETISQGNMTGKDISLEYARGPLLTGSLGGYGYRFYVDAQGQQSCVPDLPTGVSYRKWIATAVIDGTTYSWEFVVPAANGTYLYPFRLLDMVTEFLNTPGFFQGYIWDVEYQQENNSTWNPMTGFKMTYRADPNPNTTYGCRIAAYNGKPVMEFSNDGTNTYFQLNDTFTIPSDTSGIPAMNLPTIRWDAAAQTVSEGVGTVTVTATLDKPAPAQVVVPVVVGGTATYPQDHNLTGAQTITIASGASSGNFSFNVVNDSANEGPETVTLRLDGPLNAPNSVKLGTVVLHTVTIAKSDAVAKPNVSARYDLGVAGPFYNFDVFTRWNTEPASAQLYPAFGFEFQAGGSGTIGTQLQGTTKSATFTISDISGSLKANPLHANCARAGSGTTCSLTYNWVPGREYRLRVWVEEGPGQDWIGTIQDMETGTETVIGLIRLDYAPGYVGWGWMRKDADSPNGGFQWLGSSSTCNSYPLATVTWRGPYANAGDTNATHSYTSYPASSCAEINATSTGCPVTSMSAGGIVVPSNADGTDLWAAAPCAADTMTHDDFNAAKIITVLPYGDEVLTFGAATTAADDPVTSGASCGASQHSASIWYKLTAATSQTLRVSAVGSNHDTIVAVWTGTRGNLTQVACNRDNAANAGSESELDFSATAATTYYIEAAGYQSTGGGITAVSVYPAPVCGG
jgi:hypothetical protein